MSSQTAVLLKRLTRVAYGLGFGAGIFLHVAAVVQELFLVVLVSPRQLHQAIVAFAAIVFCLIIPALGVVVGNTLGREWLDGMRARMAFLNNSLNSMEGTKAALGIGALWLGLLLLVAGQWQRDLFYSMLTGVLIGWMLLVNAIISYQMDCRCHRPIHPNNNAI